ncbi:ABC transporter permease [Nonomuraea sp. M3C6]|uniref:ABC transporter permease n=1 Tax=Nonomuraea marmarensis TaxID=3351344 RepID=A0ABW7AXM1_9ACTN
MTMTTTSTGRPARRRILRRAAPRSGTTVKLSLAVLILVVLVVAFGDSLAPHSYQAVNLIDRLQAPSAQHWLGTDDLGRDAFSRVLHGVRVSVLIALGATAAGGVIGGLLGALAGWRGGVIDTVVSFLVDVQASLPSFVLALGAIVVLGGSPTTLVIVLGVEGWERFARIARAQAMGERRAGYVESALNLGVPESVVIRHHVAPALIAPLVVTATLAFPSKILIESALSFLGLGVQPPQTSLGQMVGDGRDHLATAWWIAVVPGLVIFVISLAVSIVGDYYQDRIISDAK